MLPRIRGFFVDILLTDVADFFAVTTSLVQTGEFAICYD